MNKLQFILAVFKISLTSFGGPQGHLKQFINVFCDRYKIINENDLFELNSYAQLVPGASSTQLLCLLAYRFGGILLSLITLLIWILPSSTILCIISIALQHYNLLMDGSELFSYLNPLVISYMMTMLLKSKSFYLTAVNSGKVVLINTIIILIFFKHPFLIPILLIVNGLFQHYSNKQLDQDFPKLKIKLTHTTKSLLFIFLLVFVSLGFLSEYSRKKDSPNRHFFNLAEHNFRIGSTIYGGGDILFSLFYEQYVARPTAKVTQRRNPGVLQLQSSEIMTGAGFVRMMPGPLFSITAFIAPLLFKDYSVSSQILASLIALFCLFLPGYLISIALYQPWLQYRKQIKYEPFFKGINLVIYSLLTATTIYFILELFKENLTSSSGLLVSSLEVCILLFLQLKYNPNNALLAFACILLGLIQLFL